MSWVTITAHSHNHPFSVLYGYVLFSVLEELLEALEGFVDPKSTKNGFLVKFYAQQDNHVVLKQL